VLMAVAVAANLQAENQRRAAIERITELLEKLHKDRLDDERNQLDGCRGAIDKATAILLDQGRIGSAIGLGPAVFAIETAMASAKRRLTKWDQSLEKLISKEKVELGVVRKAFPGFDEATSEFHAHLELAALAIALKRRVLVLQAVEHAQVEPGNPFEQFVRVLQADQKSVDELESGIASVLRGLSNLQLDRTHGVRDFMFSSAEVDQLLRGSRKLRELGEGLETGNPQADVALEMVRSADGSILMLPATAA
jgi:hypothetical protein